MFRGKSAGHHVLTLPEFLKFHIAPRRESVYSQAIRSVAQPGSAPRWGCGGRGFKSRRSDHFEGEVCMSKLSLLYVTFPSEEEAVEISHKLLEKKLLACVNVLGAIHSLYFWNEAIHNSKETAVLLKTTKEKIPKIISVLQELHPYDTPAILEIPVGRASDPYCRWVIDSVK